MTEQEIRRLLAVIVSFDGRVVGEPEIVVWKRVADSQNWSLDDALTAVVDYFGTETGWLMPGHITQRIRETRRKRNGIRICEI